MANFKSQIDFPTPFGTTTSDGFHTDSDFVRYYPDVVDEDKGTCADGKTHASVENALKKRVVTITLNERTYSANTANGNVDLGKVETDKSDTISGITIQSGNIVGVEIVNRQATISIKPTELKYDNSNGNLTLVDEFGISGSTIPLGLDKFVKSGSYNSETKQITLVFNDETSITINVADLIKFYSGDEQYITYVNGTTSAFTLTQSVKNTLSNVAVVSGQVQSVSGVANTNKNNITTISGKVNTISGSMNTISGNVSALSGQVTANTSNISTISGNVNEINSKYISGISVNGSAVTINDKVANINISEGRIYDADEVTIHKNPISGEEHPNEYFSTIQMTNEQLVAMLTEIGIIQPSVVKMFYTSTESTSTSTALGILANQVVEENNVPK